VLGGSNPLPFAPSAPGMMEKLTRRDTDEEGGGGGGPAKMGFSSIRGAGPGGAAGASGPKKIKAPSAPLKFAPGAPAAGKPKMMRRNTDESS
jgi:hypothetical protein